MPPTRVPIMRYQPMRSDAPSCGWQTIAAVVPAQKGLSSWSQNATYSAKQTEAHRRRPKSSGGVTARKILAARELCTSRCVKPPLSSAVVTVSFGVDRLVYAVADQRTDIVRPRHASEAVVENKTGDLFGDVQRRF